MLFVWETAEEQPDFGVDVAGLAGSVRYGWGDHPSVYVTGMVQLDATKLQQPSGSPAGSSV